MSKISIEKIEPSEFHRYHDWFHQGASDFISSAPESLESLFRDSYRALAWRMVLEGRILAIIAVAVDKTNIGRLDMVVDKRVRRQGVGSAAVREIIKLQDVKNLREIFSEVSTANVAAQKILIKNGFVRHGYSDSGNILFKLIR